MHFLITGHTGFKGAWLALLLHRMGHEVSGIALDPADKTLFHAARVSTALNQDIRRDIRDASSLLKAVAEVQPDVVIHLAAQPLVRRSFEYPSETITTNVIGTMNVLDAVSKNPSIRALLIVTSDKVYRPAGVGQVSSEGDPLGGHDIYSASKAMADLLTSAWSHSFDTPPLAIARAGNVIGGGDYGTDRLVPDLIASLIADTPLELRYPDAVRPWQHVLDCLSGYLAIVETLLVGGRDEKPAIWNIGPEASARATVAQLVDEASRAWGREPLWVDTSVPFPAENPWLALDTSKARTELGWRNRLDLKASIDWTVEWYHQVFVGQDPAVVTIAQIDAFLGEGL